MDVTNVPNTARRPILHHLDREKQTDVNRSFERWFNSKKENLSKSTSSGSTATICLIQDNYLLHIGHCRDSRAILCRENMAKTFTKDHCASSDPEEAKRIKEAGGKVITGSKGRTMVNARLAMSRSIRGPGAQEVRRDGQARGEAGAD